VRAGSRRGGAVTTDPSLLHCASACRGRSGPARLRENRAAGTLWATLAGQAITYEKALHVKAGLYVLVPRALSGCGCMNYYAVFANNAGDQNGRTGCRLVAAIIPNVLWRVLAAGRTYTGGQLALASHLHSLPAVHLFWL